MKQLLEFLINSKSTGIIKNINDGFVDLDLPSGNLWAACNLGAKNPEDKGLYYMWGYTEGYEEDKAPDNNSEHKFYNAIGQNKKYKTYGTKNLLPEDDAAYVETDGIGVIPTREDFEELLKNTKHKKDNNGIEFIGKNGFSIFFPTTGFLSDDGKQAVTGTCIVLWTNTVFDEELAWAFLTLETPEIDTGSITKYIPIRAIKRKIK